MIFKEAPIQIKMKPTSDLGGGGFHPKISGGFGGGGSRRPSVTRPTITEKIYGAHYVLMMDRHYQLDIVKNRWSEKKGPVGLTHAIDVCAEILCQQKFKGQTILFQEGMKLDLVKEMEKILFKEDYLDAVS